LNKTDCNVKRSSFIPI